MISVEDVYECNELMEPVAYKQVAILRNVGRIEAGEFPASEVLRQTGRTTLMCSGAISLMSLDQVVVIYAHNFSMARLIKEQIKHMVTEVERVTGHHIPYRKNLIVTTEHQEHLHLIGRTWDVKLTNSVKLNLEMRKTGFYK
jgi:hypothetical protein